MIDRGVVGSQIDEKAPGRGRFAPDVGFECSERPCPPGAHGVVGQSPWSLRCRRTRRGTPVYRGTRRLPRTQSASVVPSVPSSPGTFGGTEVSLNRDSSSGVLRHTFRRMRRLSGEDFRLHRLRHTFATSLLASGVDIVTISQLLGHGRILTSLLYSHSSPERKHLAIASLCHKSMSQDNGFTASKGRELPKPLTDLKKGE
jgi:Phage integrase family